MGARSKMQRRPIMRGWQSRFRGHWHRLAPTVPGRVGRPWCHRIRAWVQRDGGSIRSDRASSRILRRRAHGEALARPRGRGTSGAAVALQGRPPAALGATSKLSLTAHRPDGPARERPTRQSAPRPRSTWRASTTDCKTCMWPEGSRGHNAFCRPLNRVAPSA